MVISERVYQHLHIHIIRLQTHNVLSAENLEVSYQIPHILFDWKSEYAFRTLCEDFAFLKFFVYFLPSQLFRLHTLPVLFKHTSMSR